MELIADMLLAAGAIGAAFYCVILSRRLSRFTDLQGGMGGAVAALSTQVDEMTRALDRSRRAAGEQSGTLERSTRKAEEVARRLELLAASMHDLPAEAPKAPKAEAEERAPPPAAPISASAASAPAAPAVPEVPAPEAVRAPGPAPTLVSDAALATAWDDWDPFEVAAPAAAGGTLGASAESTPAPGLPLGVGRAGSAPVVTLPRKDAPTPIFTAARPTETTEPAAPRARAAE